MVWRAMRRSLRGSSSAPKVISPSCISACARREKTMNVKDAGGRENSISGCGDSLFSMSPIQLHFTTLVHFQPENVGSRIVSGHVEIEFALGDLAGVDL